MSPQTHFIYYDFLNQFEVLLLFKISVQFNFFLRAGFAQN